jgi:hypothetical protein
MHVVLCIYDLYNPLPLAQVMDMHASKHYAQGCINHRYIGGFMHKSPRGRFQCPLPILRGVEEQVHKETCSPCSCRYPHYKTY